MRKCKKIIDEYGRTYEFDVVDKWPEGGYVVWNIGRHNFMHPGYIPLAQVAADYHIVPETLKALYVGGENLCLYVLRAAGLGPNVDKKRYEAIKAEFIYNRACSGTDRKKHSGLHSERV